MQKAILATTSCYEGSFFHAEGYSAFADEISILWRIKERLGWAQLLSLAPTI